MQGGSLTRDEIANGFQESPGTEYLLLIYRLDGTVKWHWKLEVRHKMHKRVVTDDAWPLGNGLPPYGSRT